MKIVKPPDIYTSLFPYSVFLAGSISNGEAPPWQKEVEKLLEKTDWAVLNPRRDDWNTQLEHSTGTITSMP